MVADLSRGLLLNSNRFALNSLVQLASIMEGSPLPSETAQVVLAVPSLSTWSRLRHSSEVGQPPLRSMEWPWGLPELSEKSREDVEKSNRCLRHCLSVLGAARKRDFETELLLFHPEDFGRSTIGTPASIWQLKEVHQLAKNLALHRSAIYQCWLGPARSPSPIAMLSSMPHPLKHARRGWPTFRSCPRVDYLSPLPR